MQEIFNLVTKINNPLALAGFLSAILLYSIKYIIDAKIIPQVDGASAFPAIKIIVDRLFILALIAVILAFIGYLSAMILPSVYPINPQSPSANLDIPDPFSTPSVDIFSNELNKIVSKKNEYTPQHIKSISAQITQSLISSSSAVDRDRRRNLNGAMISALESLNDNDLSQIWRGTLPRDLDLAYVNFSGTNLRGIRFTEAFLIYANFANAKLDDAVFDQSYLRNVTFTDASMSNTSFIDSDWYNSNGVSQQTDTPNLVSEWAACPDVSSGKNPFANFIGKFNSMYGTQYEDLSKESQNEITQWWTGYRSGFCHRAHG
jgi:hypothetical protein